MSLEQADDEERYSSYVAWHGLHYGRIEGLAAHIRQTNYRINPLVARKILALIEKNEEDLYYELRIVRRSDLPAAFKDPQLREHRAADMALEVARRGGFNRAQLARVCKEVADEHGLSVGHVRKAIRPHRESAISAVEAERLEEAYRLGKLANLDPPI